MGWGRPSQPARRAAIDALRGGASVRDANDAAVEAGAAAPVFRVVTEEDREKERRRADALSRRDPDAAAAVPRYLTPARASYAKNDHASYTPAAPENARSPLQVVRGSNVNHRESRASGRELFGGIDRGGGGGGGEQALLPLVKYEPDFGRRAAPRHDAGAAAVAVGGRVGR